MFPLGSNYPVRSATPVTWAIIGLCGGIAFLQLLDGFSPAVFDRFGAVPALVSFDLLPWNRDSAYVLLSMVTSLFVHAGVLHVVGNMLFFHCFSQPVECLMGSWRYALFYLLCGLGGVLGHSLTNPWSFTPLVGASGAVAGVLAAHAVLLPWTRIRLPSSLLGPDTFPAWGFLAAWVGLQLIQGLDTWTEVAWMAHIGGVITGLLLAPLFSRPGVMVMAPTPDSDDAKEHGEGLKLNTAVSGGMALILVGGFAAWLLLLPRYADPDTVARAKGVIGFERLVGVVVPRQPETGLALYRAAAEGDRYAALELANLLHEGKLLPPDQPEAVRWYKRAADAGSQEALAHYAEALLEGDGVARDREQALALLRKLSRDGYRPAEVPLARAMEQGEGGTVDLAAAAAAYRKACDGPTRYISERAATNAACVHWALMLFAGRGVTADPAQARELLRQLAMKEVPAAQNAYGLLLTMDDPEAADIDATPHPEDNQAAGWFIKAAIAGDADAMYNAARLDELRPGPFKMTDLKRRDWFEKSAAAGNPKAKRRLRE